MSCSSINVPTTIGVAYGTTVASNIWPAEWSAKYSTILNASGDKLGPTGNVIVDPAGKKYYECLPNGEPFSTSGGSVSTNIIDTHINDVLLRREYPVTVPPADVGTVKYNGYVKKDNIPPGLSNTESGMLGQGNINPAVAYAQASSNLRANLEDEYCYYYNRYYQLMTFILTVASTNISDAGTNSSALNAPTSPYKTAIDAASKINQRLNDLILLMKQLSILRNKALSDFYYSPTDGVNQVNSDLERSRRQLQANAALLKNSQLKVDIQSAMMQYTIDKNQSSRNLLAIYGFMNIVAVGMLYYLYQNSK